MTKKPKRSVVEATAGMLKTTWKGQPPTAEELREMAEIAIAEDGMRRAGTPRREASEEGHMRPRRRVLDDKNRINLPSEVVEALGLHEGSEVAVVPIGKGAYSICSTDPTGR